MKTGWLIFLDSLLNFIVYSNFLTVYNFFYSLTVFIFAGEGIYRSEFLVLCLSGFVLSVGLRYLFQVQGSVRYGHEQLLDG